MSREGSTSSADSVPSSAMSSFSSLHSKSMNRLMLSLNLYEFKRVAKSEKIDIRRVEEDGTSLLHWFCSSGCQEIVQYLLQSRVPITKNETNGQSPLHCVVDSNDKREDTKRASIVQFLIHAGVAVDAQDVNGWTALKLACRSGLYQCASKLLQEKADAEKCDSDGNTALHDGVRDSLVTRLLISYVDDIDVTNYVSDTPLLLAVKTGAEESVRYLVHAGADVNIENGYGQFPLMLATESKNTNIVQILLDAEADVDKVEPKDNMTALHRAALNKTWQVCVLLVRHGANTEIQDKRGVTVLDYAMKLCPDMADLLRDEVAKQKSEKSAGVLEVVFEQLASGHFDRLPQLLENVPDINVQIHGHSLIHLAVAHFQFDSVVLLQRKGANLNAQMPDGNTPLHLTCQGLDKRHESLRILRFLVSSGVLLDTRNRHGETALFLAAGSGLIEHQRCLQEAGADFLKMNNHGLLPLHIACTIPETVHCVQCLLECAPDTVNAPDGDGWTPLMYASKTGCPVTVKLLLDFGAHVNALEPTKGHTALYLSVIAKSFEVCQLLVAHGANIDIRRGPRMITAFHRAALDNLTDLCLFFAERGGNIWQRDDKGNCPLDLVASPTLRRRLEERSPLKGRGMWQTDGRAAMSKAGASTGVTIPDSIYRQPIQFVNGQEEENDAMPAKATLQGSPKGSRARIGGCHIAPGELPAENRMGAPRIDQNQYVIQSNLSQIVASRMNAIQPPLPSEDEDFAVISSEEGGSEDRNLPRSYKEDSFREDEPEDATCTKNDGVPSDAIRLPTDRKAICSPSGQQTAADSTHGRPTRSINARSRAIDEALAQEHPTSISSCFSPATTTLSSSSNFLLEAVSPPSVNQQMQVSHLGQRRSVSDVADTMKAEIAQLKEEIAQLKEVKEQQKEDNLRLREGLTRLHRRIETLVEKEESQNQSLKRREEENKDLTSKVSRLTKEKEGLSQTVEQLRRDLEDVRNKEHDLQQTVSRQHESNRTLAKDKDVLQRQLTERKESVAAMIKEKESLQSQLSDKEGTIAALRQKTEDIRRQKDLVDRQLQLTEKELQERDISLNIPEKDLTITSQKLGKGSYAAVFVGKWRGVPVAVKVFHKELRTDVPLEVTERIVHLIRREVATCAQVRHPNVMSTCGATYSLGVPLRLVLEMEEASLDNVIDAAHASGKYLTMREQVDIAEGCLCGVMYLHGIRDTILHGDIRSTNVLVTKTMEAKIGDLGAARLSSHRALSVGPLSLEYVAPERMPRSDGTSMHNTVQADVYSLGVTLLELFTGREASRKERVEHLRALSHPRLQEVTAKMMVESFPVQRMTIAVALQKVSGVEAEESYQQSPPKRMVRGILHGVENTQLVDKPWL